MKACGSKTTINVTTEYKGENYACPSHVINVKVDEVSKKSENEIFSVSMKINKEKASCMEWLRVTIG